MNKKIRAVQIIAASQALLRAANGLERIGGDAAAIEYLREMARVLVSELKP